MNRLFETNRRLKKVKRCCRPHRLGALRQIRVSRKETSCFFSLLGGESSGMSLLLMSLPWSKGCVGFFWRNTK
jgi:hypothetical protein